MRESTLPFWYHLEADNGDDVSYGTWNIENSQVNVDSTYRIAWRAMAATTGFRTLYPALIPSGSKHINGIVTAGPITSPERVIAGAFAGSLAVDFLVRSTGIANLYGHIFENLPIISHFRGKDDVLRTYLRLNCITSQYAPLWEKMTEEPWSTKVPFRTVKDRVKAQVRIDVIIASSLGISVEELCMIYRIQFPVMRRYDREDLYDANGRRVPVEIRKLHNQHDGKESLPIDQRTWQHPQSNVTYQFQYPFAPLDREAEFHAVHEELKRLGEIF